MARSMAPTSIGSLLAVLVGEENQSLGSDAGVGVHQAQCTGARGSRREFELSESDPPNGRDQWPIHGRVDDAAVGLVDP
jgi:hypothetical protein